MSNYLSWLNIWQFRWRNWRIDILWAIVYISLASSLFPLCGIYEDFISINPTHDPLQLTLSQLASWVAKKITKLFFEIFLSGRVSAIAALGVTAATYYSTDTKISLGYRVLWGCGHGFLHIFSALSLFLFVQCLIEWSIYDGIVHVSQVQKDTGVDLASSMYEEFTDHFMYMYKWMQSANMTAFQGLNSTITSTGGAGEEIPKGWHLHDTILDGMKLIALFFSRIPLLRTAMSIFDLPGLIAQKHLDICEVLCRGGDECMIQKNAVSFQLVNRATMLPYMFAVSLYITCLAIPLAGSVMGTWLALTLVWFRAQYNEGFSSLRLPHWKNFLRLHIKENGDLEVFAIGLQRVPKRWMKDPRWDGSIAAKRMRLEQFLAQTSLAEAANEDIPSWKWKNPSKWIPKNNSKNFTPQLIDYTCIQRAAGVSEGQGKGIPSGKRSRSFESYNRLKQGEFRGAKSEKKFDDYK